MKRIGLHRLKIYKAVYDISTVETPDGIFETLVWHPKSGKELEQKRYATEEEAMKGHIEIMRKWQDIAYDGSIDKVLGYENVGQFVEPVVCPKVAV